jgi:hypothetical protein
MKSCFAFLAALFILSCSDQSGKPAGNNAAKREVPSSVGPNMANPIAPVDVSPMDVTYFPVDYPKLKMAHSGAEPLKARVIYSRPQKQGREIFGALIKYGEPWRLGANEATEIELFQSATIQGKKIDKGRYILYCIPQPAAWTVIFNGNIDTWGLKTDTTLDIHRFTIPVEKMASPLEHFTLAFQNRGKDADLVMAWDSTMARLPFQF